MSKVGRFFETQCSLLRYVITLLILCCR